MHDLQVFGDMLARAFVNADGDRIDMLTGEPPAWMGVRRKGLTLTGEIEDAGGEVLAVWSAPITISAPTPETPPATT